MLKILVCVKQVPNVEQMQMDPETGTLIREGVESILNPLDANALAAAISLKEKFGAEITAISMGPQSAETALRSCIAMGADKAVLLSDRAFANADTLATSYVITEGSKMIDSFDLVFCGRETLDGATGQMGSQLAERFGISQVTGASLISSVDIQGRIMRVERKVDKGTEILDVKLPCLLTIEKDNYPERIPNIRRNIMSKKANIQIITSADIPELDKSQIGDPGSPTKVPKMVPPVMPEPGLVLRGGASEENIARLIAYIKE